MTEGKYLQQLNNFPKKILTTEFSMHYLTSPLILEHFSNTTSATTVRKIADRDSGSKEKKMKAAQYCFKA
jgi:hypothetical protein